MIRSLANVVEDLSELNKPIIYKKCSERKNKYDLFCYFDKLVDNRLQYKCQDCNTYSHKPLNPIKELSKNTYEFCEEDNSRFIQLLLRKGAYPFEYMDLFERLKETCLSEYDDFYSELDQSNISKSDYEHAQKVWNTFKIINMNEFQDLYVKSDTLQLTDVCG